jgi:hypothetical protein
VGTNICKLGDPVRLGFEGSNTVNWCDPLPPNAWNGQKLLRRQNGKCDWGDAVPYQCFGLGPERLHQASNTRLAKDDCAAACCASPTCEIWQQADGRGCYFSNSADVGCDKSLESTYVGGRKCIPGFCGDAEEQKLFPHIAR